MSIEKKKFEQLHLKTFSNFLLIFLGKSNNINFINCAKIIFIIYKEEQVWSGWDKKKNRGGRERAGQGKQRGAKEKGGKWEGGCGAGGIRG